NFVRPLNTGVPKGYSPGTPETGTSRRKIDDEQMLTPCPTALTSLPTGLRGEACTQPSVLGDRVGTISNCSGGDQAIERVTMWPFPIIAQRRRDHCAECRRRLSGAQSRDKRREHGIGADGDTPLLVEQLQLQPDHR